MELGGNYLNTTFTGTFSKSLSGHPEFPFLTEDMGIASDLKDQEFKKPDCPKKH